MKVKFKKRFRSKSKTDEFIIKHLGCVDNIFMSATFNKSKSRNGKKTYYNLSGWYESVPKEKK